MAHILRDQLSDQDIECLLDFYKGVDHLLTHSQIVVHHRQGELQLRSNECTAFMDVLRQRMNLSPALLARNEKVHFKVVL